MLFKQGIALAEEVLVKPAAIIRGQWRGVRCNEGKVLRILNKGQILPSKGAPKHKNNWLVEMVDIEHDIGDEVIVFRPLMG